MPGAIAEKTRWWSGCRNLLNERCYGIDSIACSSIFVRFHGNLTEKREKLTQKTASVLVRFMEKGFYAALYLTSHGI